MCLLGEGTIWGGKSCAYLDQGCLSYKKFGCFVTFYLWLSMFTDLFNFQIYHSTDYFVALAEAINRSSIRYEAPRCGAIFISTSG